jgi:lipoprotein-releasing system ATP-binding protein
VGATEDVAIRTVHLAKIYPSGQSSITVFRDLDLEIRAGEQVAIMGASGSGKSTLMHLLGGLDRPSEGRIYFGSKETTELSDAELSDFRNRQIGFVWQSHGLLPEFTALENVMMPLLIRGGTRRKATDAARLELRRLGLEDRAHHRAGELSGGEQQRVALARALVTNPSVLLADEPTGNLDYRTAETIIAVFEELHASRKLTSVVVTHNSNFAKRCHRVLMLDKGKVREENPQPPVTETVRRDTNGSTYV